MEPVDGIKSLTSSECRVNILELLSEHDSLEKQELRSNLEASRTTVGRNVEALNELGWVDGVGSEYSITRPGRLIAEKFGELAAAMEITEELEGFLEWVPDGSLNIDLGLLSDAEIVTPETGDPYSMVNKHVDTVRNSANHRMVMPVIGLHSFEVGHEKVVNQDSESEIVVTPDIAEVVQTDQDYSVLYEDMVETGRFKMHVTDAPIPYYLGILDDTVNIGVSEEGEPRAVLESQSEPVRKWAVNRFNHFVENSEPLSVSAD